MLSAPSPTQGEGGITLSLGAWRKEAFYQRKSGYLAFMKVSLFYPPLHFIY